MTSRTYVAATGILVVASAVLLRPAAGRAQSGEATGVFYQTEGLTYRTAAGAATTNAKGEFTFRRGDTVTFAVGDLVLGSVAMRDATPRLTAAHLVPEVAGNVKKIRNGRVTNIARFLQSLDEDGNLENGIRISRTASEAVSRRGTINFDQSEDAFEKDPGVVALFAELKTSLRTGPQARNELRRTLLGVRKFANVKIPTRDPNVQLIGDLFLPMESGKYPVVLSATKYGKAFGRGCTCTSDAVLAAEKTEDVYYEYEPAPGKPPRPANEVSVMPNSVDWVPQGYALLRIDGRGSCNTPGLLHPYSAQEAEDNYDAIEWAGTQTWSNGNVGMWGVSFTAASALPVASLNPPHLKAVIPHSADIDQYRDIVFQGGLYYTDYREPWFKNQVASRALRCLDQPFTDILEMFHQNRFADPKVYGPYTKDPATGQQLPIGPVSPDPAKLTLPIWSHMRQDIWPIHIRGGSEVYIQAASKNKKLWVEAGHEYDRAWSPEVFALHVKFFDYWLKGIKNDIMKEPPVRLDVRQPRDAEHPNGWWKTRFEQEWPLARTKYVKYYLDATNPSGDGTLSPKSPSTERSTTYAADPPIGKDPGTTCSAQGVSFMSEPLAEDTELVGYGKLGLRVSSTSTDMDIFATLRVMDEAGKEVLYHSTTSQSSPVTVGFLKVSHRKLDSKRSTIYQPVLTHTRADYQPLAPNEKVQAEVELWPNTAFIKKGHRLSITIQPRDGCFASAGRQHEYDEKYHTGASNSIHTGGVDASYLQIPVIPRDARPRGSTESTRSK
jgi:predicted acyl esterase